MLNVQEGAQSMHGLIEGLESRVFGKEGLEAQAIGGREVVLSFAQSPQEAAVVLDGGGNLAS